MKNLFLFLTFSAVAFSQTATVTGIGPAQTRILEAWRAQQCASSDVNGACLTLRWASFDAMMTDAAMNGGVNARIKEAVRWALQAYQVAGIDVGLPNAIKTAIDSQKTSQAVIDAASPR